GGTLDKAVLEVAVVRGRTSQDPATGDEALALDDGPPVGSPTLQLLPVTDHMVDDTVDPLLEGLACVVSVLACPHVVSYFQTQSFLLLEHIERVDDVTGAAHAQGAFSAVVQHLLTETLELAFGVAVGHLHSAVQVAGVDVRGTVFLEAIERHSLV